MASTKTNPMYQDIWDILKAKKKCKVAAHPALHRRIIHAVVNKKYYDNGYKFELSERMEHAILTYSRGTNYIQFELRYYPCIRSMLSINIGDI